jgi:hypothetical protein
LPQKQQATNHTIAKSKAISAQRFAAASNKSIWNGEEENADKTQKLRPPLPEPSRRWHIRATVLCSLSVSCFQNKNDQSAPRFMHSSGNMLEPLSKGQLNCF